MSGAGHKATEVLIPHQQNALLQIELFIHPLIQYSFWAQKGACSRLWSQKLGYNPECGSLTGQSHSAAKYTSKLARKVQVAVLLTLCAGQRSLHPVSACFQGSGQEPPEAVRETQLLIAQPLLVGVEDLRLVRNCFFGCGPGSQPAGTDTFSDAEP